MGRERFDRTPIVWRLHKQKLGEEGIIDAQAMDSYAREAFRLYEQYKGTGLSDDVYQRLSIGGRGSLDGARGGHCHSQVPG